MVEGEGTTQNSRHMKLKSAKEVRLGQNKFYYFSKKAGKVVSEQSRNAPCVRVIGGGNENAE